jgi:Transposase DDE domain
MFDRLVETFCEFDNFCKSVQPQWEATLVTDGETPDRKHAPEGGLCDSEIMTLLVLYHGARFKDFKTFYNGIVLGMLRPYFRRAPCYGRFIRLTKRVWALLAFFLASRMGRKTDIITSTARHSSCATIAGSAATRCLKDWPRAAKQARAGSLVSSCIWCSITGAIVALKLTPGNVSNTAPVPELTKDLVGKLFGDKGYLGRKLAHDLLRRGLVLMTRVRRNMKARPVSFFDKALLDGRNIAETIIGHIKEFSSLRLPKHRSVFNAFTHITATIIAYQIDPLPPQPIRAFFP